MKYIEFIISIHAPRTGSDTLLSRCCPKFFYFNPRSPHGERHFNPPANGGERNISIHAPRTGSDGGGSVAQRYGRISIHAPRTGSDPRRGVCIPVPSIFQSTLPARGATVKAGANPAILRISIHAPRTGSDLLCQPVREPQRKQFQSTLPARGATAHRAYTCCTGHFNPRSPHGERP